MTRLLSLIFVMVIGLVTFASAGTIAGTISPGNSVVYIDTIAGKTFPAPAQHPLIDQKGLKFHPGLLVVQQGTTVEFQNDDSVQHNVFWPSVGGNRKEAHNLGTWPQGEKRSFKFDQPGVVPLLCNVHPEMSGYIIVSPTPYFAPTDANGNYKLENVPDGKYNLVIWHEGSKPQIKPVTVAGNTTVNVSLPK
jgi:plastocyanin